MQHQCIGVDKGHLVHLEDLPLLCGAQGVQAIDELIRSIRNSPDNVKCSIKIDGAPASFVGKDAHGRKFVAKKSIFNKEPKVYYSPVEVAQDTDGELCHILTLLLEMADVRNMPESFVLHGDFLFLPSHVRTFDYNGTKWVGVLPNVIMYALPANKANAFTNATMGVVWHSAYVGEPGSLRIVDYDDHCASMASSMHTSIVTFNPLLRTKDIFF